MRRLATVRRLEEFVRTHRFTIAVVVPLVGALLLVASAEGFLPAAVAFHPGLLLAGLVVMRLPLLVGILPLVDRRAVGLLLLASAYAYSIEYVGIVTGWPYGSFSYGVGLGPMVAGVPVALPLLFLPLVVNAYLLTLVLLGPGAHSPFRRFPVALGLVLAIDLVLDPGAVSLGFWTYADGGAYYGVPLANFLGWALSGSVAVAVLAAAFPIDRLLERLDACEFFLDDLVSFVLLWGAINALYANLIPVGIALVVAAGLLRSERFDAIVLPHQWKPAVRRAP